MQPRNETLYLDVLEPHPKNYNRHPPEQVRRLAKSLTKFGQVRSVVVWRGTLLAGHGVVEAARILNWRTVRADVLPDDYPEHLALAYIAADNEMAKQGDPDMAQLAAILEESKAADADLLEAIGYSDKEFEALLKEVGKGAAGVEDAGAQVDKADELRQKWQTAPGQLWQLGDHRLICGDCTDPATVARVMGGERAQAVVTSPPYPGAEMWDDMGVVAEVERVGLDALRLCVPVLDDGCPILWNVANTPLGTHAGAHITTTTTKVAANELGLLCYGEIIWSKPLQHLTPISFMMRPVVPNLVHEYVMIFYKGRRKQRENISGLSDEDKAIRTKSVWELQTESAKEVNHKAPFPFELARRCVALWSLESDVIYEPFDGSGTTIIACEKLGRKCRACEISPAYVGVALERWAMSTGKTPVLVEAA